MISTADEEYKATKQVKRGTLHLDTKYLPFVTWIHETFGFKPLHIMTFELSDAMRLELIFEYRRASQFFESYGITDSLYNKEYTTQISNKFSSLYLPKDHKRLFVTISSFAPFAISEAKQKMTVGDIESIEKKYKTVWKIHNGYVLFYTRRQQTDPRNIAIKKSITHDYYTCIKRHDEFNYIHLNNLPIYFTSKEHFYKNYNGNWYNLYR